MQPSLLFDQGGGGIPYSETLAPGQDVRITSVNAKWNGAAASGTFLACLSLYSQSGVLLSRSFPSQQFAAGDSGVVTYAPPLGASAAAAASSSVYAEWPVDYHYQGVSLWNATGSHAYNLAVDENVPGDVYIDVKGGNSRWIAYPIQLGPGDPTNSQRSMWFLIGKGPNSGIVDIQIASAWNSSHTFVSASAASYVTMRSIDLYAAADTWATTGWSGTDVPLSAGLTLTGAWNTVGTTYNSVTGVWDGGPGMQWIRFKLNGKNAASGGYECRIFGWGLTNLEAGARGIAQAV